MAGTAERHRFAAIIRTVEFHCLEETTMRRDTFLKSPCRPGSRRRPAAAGARAAANLKMMIPANPGGGWDTTGRALGKALQDAGVGRLGQLRQQGRRRRRASAWRSSSTAARATRTR